MKTIIGVLFTFAFLSVNAQITDTGDKVGIGITSPDAKLHVNGAIKTNRFGTYGTYSSAEVQGIWSLSEAYLISTTNNNFGNQYGMGYAFSNVAGAPFTGVHQIVFTHNGTVNASIGLNGKAYFKENVGIGTTVPYAGLTVVNGDNIKSVIATSVSPVATAPLSIQAAEYLHLGAGEYETNSYRLIGFGYNAGTGYNYKSPSYIGYQETSVAGYTKGDLIFGTRGTTYNEDATERMRIKSNGNIGIGTTSPSAKLHIVDEGTSGVTTFQLNERIKFRGDGVMNWGEEADYGILSWATGKAVIGASSGKDLSLIAGGAERVFVKANGNIGIGTTYPAHKLNVVNTSSNNSLNISHNAAGFAAEVIATDQYGMLITSTANGGHYLLNLRGNGGAIQSIYAASNGNVGIGTATPEHKLDVRGSDSYQFRAATDNVTESNNAGVSIYNAASAEAENRSSFITLDPNGADNVSHDYTYLAMYGSGDAKLSNSHPSGSLTFGTNALDRMTILPNGNVGIGTTTPSAKLYISGTHYDSQFIIHSLGGSNIESQADLSLWASEPGLTYSGAGIGNNILNKDGGINRISTARGGSYMRLLEGRILLHVVKNDGTDIEAINILENGNVGIRTATPRGYLDLNTNRNVKIYMGTAGTIGEMANSAGDYIANNMYSSAYDTYTKTTAGAGNMILQDYAKGITFYTGVEGAIAETGTLSTYERLRIDPDGNVGIGTSVTNGYKLAVEGTIGARVVKVEAIAWSDFVFDKDYELPSLAEVEKHIATKGHLKDIPSAEEVTADGINLGEMDAKLLQKIEELTLYLIEQNKEIEKYNMKNEELCREIELLKQEIKIK